MITAGPIAPNAGAASTTLIEYHELGVVIRSPCPVSLFAALAKHFKSEGYKLLSVKLCGPLNAAAVLVRSDEDADRWAAQIDEAALRHCAGIEELAWLKGTDTGTSSRTIFSVLSEYGQLACVGWSSLGAPPCDPDDFGRCHRLLERFPSWRPRIGEVAAKYPRWALLVENWTELEQLYREELPTKMAPKLYALMQELLER